MPRIYSRLVILGLAIFVLLIYCTSSVNAQEFGEDWIEDDEERLHIYLELGNRVVKHATEDEPILLDFDNPMPLHMQINLTSESDLNMSGKIWFYYQDLRIFSIEIKDPASNVSYVMLPHDANIEPIDAAIDFSQILEISEDYKVITGIFRSSVDFEYNIMGETEKHIATVDFYLLIPADLIEIITSPAGIATAAATVSAVFGLGFNLNSLIDGLKTAHKLRGIHKKASEIRSLPNLAVIGALPLLFSILASLTGKQPKIRKKKLAEGEEPPKSGVTEYIVRQRLREVAPEAWPKDICPKCKRTWKEESDTCTKCGIDINQAKLEYTDILVAKVPAALKALGNKNEMTIRDLAKKTKSNDYNAGVIAAAMVDTEVTEILKVGTPFRTFIMNIAGLAFLVLTWQTLLGDSTSSFQSTLTYVGAALSLAIIIALYVSRKSQVEKFRAEVDAGAKLLPTAVETAVVEESGTPEVHVEPDESSTESEDTSYEMEESEDTYDDEFEEDTPSSEETSETENGEEPF
jgi:hypothetical protein